MERDTLVAVNEKGEVVAAGQRTRLGAIQVRAV